MENYLMSIDGVLYTKVASECDYENDLFKTNHIILKKLDNRKDINEVKEELYNKKKTIEIKLKEYQAELSIIKYDIEQLEEVLQILQD